MIQKVDLVNIYTVYKINIFQNFSHAMFMTKQRKKIHNLQIYFQVTQL